MSPAATLMPPKGKKRLDALLVERGLFPSRARAQAALLAGLVKVVGRDLPLKAGTTVPEDAQLEVSEPFPYVGRGGVKLEGALKGFGVDPKGRVCIDLGSSTGGFTDCLLQNGAAKVYAVDVGRGQLDAKLRGDPRVVVMEGFHAKDMRPKHFPDGPDLAVTDVSFISLTKVLPPLLACLKPPFDVLALIKPQFELTPRDVPRGIVRDEAARSRAVEGLLAFARGLDVESLGVLPSPLKGAKGNVEYLWHLRKK